MANTTLPLLTAGAAVQSGDLFISRQGADTVDKKVTAAQLATFLGGPSFSAITSGTNTTAAMAVGTGASLTYSGSGTITATHAAIANEATDTTCFPLFVTTATGDQALKSNAAFTLNSNTGALGATSFSGAGTGLTGTAASLTAGLATALATARLIGNVSFNGTADITPTQIQPAAENSDTTCFPLFVNAASGTAQQPKYNASLGFNASTGNLTSTLFNGVALTTGGTATNYLAGDGTYKAAFTLTTTGTSGAATFSSGTLNIPQYTGGGSPGGSNTQVQYNNSSAFGGASNLTIDAGGNANLGEYTTTTPAAPSAGDTLFSRKRVNYSLPAFINPTNRWNELFPFPNGRLNGSAANGLGNGAVTPSFGGTGGNSTAGTATAKSFDGTTYGGSICNLTYNTGASTGSSAGLTVGTTVIGAIAFRGTVAGTGGFHLVSRFGLDTISANHSWFCGLWSTATDMGNVDPSTLTNIIGFGIDSGQTTVRFINNDGAGTATMTDLGANFPAATAGVYYEARIYCAPNGSTIYYSLERLESAQFIEGSVSSDIPGTTTAMAYQLHQCTRTSSTAGKMSFSKYLLISDL